MDGTHHSVTGSSQGLERGHHLQQAGKINVVDKNKMVLAKGTQGEAGTAYILQVQDSLEALQGMTTCSTAMAQTLARSKPCWST